MKVRKDSLEQLYDWTTRLVDALMRVKNIQPNIKSSLN